MELIEKQVVQAKRKHECRVCSKPIEVGEKYYKELFRENNRFFFHKTCLKCKSILTP